MQTGLAPEQARESSARRGVTGRALLIAFAVVPLNVLFLVKGVCAWSGVVLGPIFYNTLTILFALALLNRWLKRRWPARAFRPGEMLTIYALLSMSTGLVGTIYSVGGSLQAIITYPFWFASPENRWQELLWPYLPSWLTVRDRGVVEGFWRGDASLYRWAVIRAWSIPTLWWASFMTAVFWVTLCLNSIVRRRWEDEEKLPFPFVTVPVQLVEERYGLLRSKSWWIGVGISAALGVWGVLQGLFPKLPGIPLAFDFTGYIVNRPPWSIIAGRFTAVSWQPLYLGLCYLMPLDLLFSLWVFGLLWLAQEVVSYQLGWYTAGSGFPFVDHQAIGGLFGLVLAVLWLDRHYLAQVVRKAFGLKSALPEDMEEAFKYRTALLGAILGLAYCCWFWMRTGVPASTTLAFLLLYYAVAIQISRIRAQVGSPVHELWMIPDTVLRTMVGPLALGPRTIGMLTLLTPYLIGDQENAPAPIQLEALKMASEGRMERRRLAVALALVVFPTVLCSFWAYLHFGYRLGFGSAKISFWQVNLVRWIIETMDSSLRQPTPVNAQASLAMGFGLITTQALFVLKMRLPWWPLHPIAMPICNTWVMHYFTVALIVIWLLKLLLMRYGGLRAHRAALPFFIGLLVGDSAIGISRAVIFLTFNIGT